MTSVLIGSLTMFEVISGKRRALRVASIASVCMDIGCEYIYIYNPFLKGGPKKHGPKHILPLRPCGNDPGEHLGTLEVFPNIPKQRTCLIWHLQDAYQLEHSVCHLFRRAMQQTSASEGTGRRSSLVSWSICDAVLFACFGQGMQGNMQGMPGR